MLMLATSPQELLAVSVMEAGPARRQADEERICDN
jgi:hypothetical protein